MEALYSTSTSVIPPIPHPRRQVLLEIAEIHHVDRLIVRGEKRHESMGVGILDYQQAPPVADARGDFGQRMIPAEEIGVFVPSLQIRGVVKRLPLTVLPPSYVTVQGFSSSGRYASIVSAGISGRLALE